MLEGLSKTPKGLPSHFFYDDRGSELFKQIMALEEYYPTQCESEILNRYGANIASHVEGQHFNLIELGCGNGAKTIMFLESLLKAQAKFNFFPLDISPSAVQSLLDNIKEKYSELPFGFNGLVAEYFQGLRWLTRYVSQRNMVLFLGSNIGNFPRSTAMRFLRHLWHCLNPGDLVLIGFDLKKDLDVLYNAYNDKSGVTKEFNLNVLDRINRVLSGDFQRDQFLHQGLYNVQTGAMESYLISLSHQKVRIEGLGKTFEFLPWEAIHMEFSYKFLESDIEDWASSTGFRILNNFHDSRGYFVDSLWEVVK
ncbi:MAG: L-histidine N(alpha)-methyltransferase [Bdellovibrionales bacterium]|nr:L-histidine N(alpha)-methyltransferase [Bdellovibrionales bacterium]